LTGNEVRKTFLRFFEERSHRVVRSSSLVPANDVTLLFTNAGMNQFKDVFLGLEQRDYKRATSCQKCVRAGGKHNDLENVGFTNRHLTFFEMLGNFSFGDYFKKETIEYAMELVTSTKWFGVPLDKLHFTVFGGAEIGLGSKLDTDSEAAAHWANVGAPKDRIVAVPGLKENFWAMGDTGPCGPCSEIFYDMGPAASDQGHADCKFPCDCGRYVEIWNLVFMQFNRDVSGKLNPLPKPSVDTGMGLERMTAVLEGKISIFESDLFMPLIHKAEAFTSARYGRNPKTDPSFRIVADHARATTFLIGDGVLPSNEGRGYVLRKIMRRGMRHVRLLQPEKPFFTDLVLAVRELMADAYPELMSSVGAHIPKVVAEEERRFIHTVEVALAKLEDAIKSAQVHEKTACLDSFLKTHGSDWDREFAEKDVDAFLPNQQLDARRVAAEPLVVGAKTLELRNYFKDHYHPKLAGVEIFKLYDTFGLPRDFIEDVAHDAGVEVDWAGFDRAMEEQRARAKASWKGVGKEVANPAYAKLAQTFKTEPAFYSDTKTHDARIEAIVTKNGPVNEIKPGAEAEVVLDRSSIYAESGGQVADTGGFYDNSESQEVAEVRGAYYPVTGLIAHRVVAKEDLHVGDRVATVADAERRARNMRNHTATHLMNAALRNILGTHVKQSGSLVAPDHLRFDFTHFAAVDPSELADIEQQVNEEIRKDLEIRTDIMNIDDALASGALAFFGDKYPEANVRVVTIPDRASPRGFYSKELCGGTHVPRTGAIGVFKIMGEQSTAAGIRRIEAISGDRALAEYQRALSTLRTAAGLLNASEEQLIPALERQIEHVKTLEKQLEAQKRKAAGSQVQGLIDQAREVKGVRVVAAQVEGLDREALRSLSDSLRQKLRSGVIFLASAEDGKIALITAVTKDLTSKLHAGKIVQELAKFVGGSGGGRPDLAEAGGKDTSGIEKAIGSIYPLVERLL
jgi:alanyl-tRNA synthetase